jgi:hypothetical protein
MKEVLLSILSSQEPEAALDYDLLDGTSHSGVSDPSLYVEGAARSSEKE